jgi:hypothetical protein
VLKREPQVFSIFISFEQGQLFLLLGNLRNAIQYAVGYPLLAIQTIAHAGSRAVRPCD